MDPEGTLIVLVFCNKEINRWQSMLTRGHTYYISNSFVKAYDTCFRSAHPILEITLNNKTTIEEAGDKLRFDPIRCNPVEFEHVKKEPATFGTVDMLGTLGSVHPLTIFTHRKKNIPVPKKLITIRNNRQEEVTLALTSDLATSEGAELHEIWPSEVTVLVTTCSCHSNKRPFSKHGMLLSQQLQHLLCSMVSAQKIL